MYNCNDTEHDAAFPFGITLKDVSPYVALTTTIVASNVEVLWILINEYLNIKRF